jgi:hypothetical protein
LAAVREIIQELAGTAAIKATEQLRSLAFGAIEKVLVAGVEMGSDEGVEYYTVSWSVVSMGMEDSRVNMVILPEFLGEDGGSDLAAQMAAYVVDTVLEGAQAD